MTTETSAQADTIPFNQAVAEGKQILADAEHGQWRLGELADKVVHPTYGDRTLAKFADELGISPCTLARYRDVFRAWMNIDAPGRESISYTVLRTLAPHPDRARIIRENPEITKRKAHDLMHEYRGAAEGKAKERKARGGTDWQWQKHNANWFKNVRYLANEAIRAAEVAYQCPTPEQRHNLLMAVDPYLLPEVRKGGVALVALADYLDKLLDEITETAISEGRIKFPPEPAQTAAEASMAA